MSRNVIVTEIVDLGIIKLVDSDTKFPWEFFINGEINCAFQTATPKHMNDIRIWINQNSEGTVYIERYRYGPRPVSIAFTNPEDAAKFVLKFGDLVKKYD